MAPNPVTVIIPANCQGQISAFSNASYIQQVTVSLGNIKETFTGTGEGVAMMTADKSDSLTFPTLVDAQSCTLYFQYSDNPGDWNDSVVNNPVIVSKGPFTTITITSEDASDHDNNDTILSMFCFSVNASASFSTSEDEDPSTTKPATADSANQPDDQ